MRNLTKQGKSIIFITHKLREVLEVQIESWSSAEERSWGPLLPPRQIVMIWLQWMVGRAVKLEVEKKPSEPKETVLEVKDLMVTDSLNQVMVDGVSFKVRAGEILGIAGVQGNGQPELAESVTGLRKPYGGEILLLGNDVTHKRPENSPRSAALTY